MAKSASTPRVRAAGTAPPRGRGLLGAGSGAGSAAGSPSPAAPAALLPPAPVARRVLRSGAGAPGPGQDRATHRSLQLRLL